MTGACVALMLGCAARSASTSNPPIGIETQGIAEVDWIEGEWVTTDGDSEFREGWVIGGDATREGISCVGRGGGVKGLGRALVEARSDGLYYVADPDGQQVTTFRLTKSEPGVALFSNPTHDWPQFIEYRRRGERLEASASGMKDGKERRRVWAYTWTELAEAACRPVP